MVIVRIYIFYARSGCRLLVKKGAYASKATLWAYYIILACYWEKAEA